MGNTTKFDWPSQTLPHNEPSGFTFVSGGPSSFIVSLPELPRMNALTGAGSIFALFGNYYDHRAWVDKPQSDAVAILHDWVVVGRDIRRAIEKFKTETEAKQLQLF